MSSSAADPHVLWRFTDRHASHLLPLLRFFGWNPVPSSSMYLSRPPGCAPTFCGGYRPLQLRFFSSLSDTSSHGLLRSFLAVPSRYQWVGRYNAKKTEPQKQREKARLYHTPNLALAADSTRRRRAEHRNSQKFSKQHRTQYPALRCAMDIRWLRGL